MKRLMLVSVLFLLAGCTASVASKKIETSPLSSISVPGDTVVGTTPASSSAPPKVAHVGSSLALADGSAMPDGEALTVTLVHTRNNPGAADDFSTPAAGKRYYAVQFRITNTAKTAFSDTPSNGAKVADTKGQQFEATFSDTNAGPSFPGSLDLTPGASALGWITFEVPVNAVIASVQFALDSGFGAVGQWRIS